MKKNVLLAVLLMLSLSLTVVGCKNHEEKDHNESSLGAEKADLAMNDVYQCPMDCEEGKTYEEEGQCPVCKMDLKKVEKEDTKDNDTSKEEDDDDHSGHDHD